MYVKSLKCCFAHTWWSLDESETSLKRSFNSVDLTGVVAVQHYAFIDINVVIITRRWIRYFSYEKTRLYPFTAFNITRRSPEYNTEQH